MKSEAEDFVARLLKGDADRQPTASIGDADLPSWFDEKKYNRGRKFVADFYFGFLSSFFIAIMVVIAIPSMIKIFVGTRKSNSAKTAYRRYYSLFQQVFTWLNYELKPGSQAWNSIQNVRKAHLNAMKGAKLKGHGTITQRDVALSLCATASFSILKPDEFGIFGTHQDWEAFTHFWSVIGDLLGLEERYNMCLKPFEEMYEISQILMDRVFAPCLENPPEYFEHLIRVAIEGASAFYPPADSESLIYLTKKITGVPGFITKESERISLRKKILISNGNNADTGVKSTDLMEKCAIEGLPKCEARILYLSDYNSIDMSPAYRQLSMVTKYKLAFSNIMIAFYSTVIGRTLINLYVKFILLIGKYFPYLAILRFGFSGVFLDNVVDDTVPKSNSEFYKPHPSKAWYDPVF